MCYIHLWITFAVIILFLPSLVAQLNMASADAIDAQQTEKCYDREKELQEFDSTKAGVKGLVDGGLDKIPRIFIHAPQDRPDVSDIATSSHLQVPVIDLKGTHDSKRKAEVVAHVLDASSKWGFFQIVNHGIPLDVLGEMLLGIRRFNEQPNEVKTQFYSRDLTRKVKFSTNYDLFQSPAANWRDTLTASFDIGPFNPQELPQACRDVVIEYTNHIKRLGDVLTEFLSEALGLPRHHLKDTKAFDSLAMAAHYYPPCPQPQLTLGTSKHTDPSFLTILLQDHIGGLQVLHQGHWVDVTPVHGALVVNIGDLLQLVSNGLFKSVNHRVVASSAGPRMSVACFIQPHRSGQQQFGPMKELLSENNPPRYREVTMAQFMAHFFSKPLDQYYLDNFKV